MSGPNRPIHIDEADETVYFHENATENNLRNTFLKKNVAMNNTNAVGKVETSRRRHPRRRRTDNVRRRKQIQRKSRKRSLRH
jgi:hypothetical protein